MRVLSLAALAFISAVPIYQGQVAKMVVPDRQIANGAISVQVLSRSAFINWTNQEHLEVFQMKKLFGKALRENGSDVLFFQKSEPGFSSDLQMVPFPKGSFFVRNYRLLRTIFQAKSGGVVPLDPDKLSQSYQELFAMNRDGSWTLSQKECLFPCNERIRSKQVVFSGEKAWVLCNQKQVTSQNNDFLIIPKTHYEHIADVDDETGLEMSVIMAKIAALFHAKGYRVYFFQKNGANAGQTIPHFHIHAWAEPLNVSENRLLISTCKNFFFPSKLSDKQLQTLVEEKKKLFVRF